MRWAPCSSTLRRQARRSKAALNEALRIAEDLNDTDYKLRVLWCLWCLAHNCGAFRDALALADRFCDISKDSRDPVDP